MATEASGMTFVQGLLTKECGAALKAALDAWSAPQPAEDGTLDPRSPGQRRHDALQHLAETTLATNQVTDLPRQPRASHRPRHRRDARRGGRHGRGRACHDATEPTCCRRAAVLPGSRRRAQPWRAVGRGRTASRPPQPTQRGFTPASAPHRPNATAAAPGPAAPHPPLVRRPPPDPLGPRRTHRTEQRRPALRTPPPPRPHHRSHRARAHPRPRHLGHRPPPRTGPPERPLPTHHAHHLIHRLVRQWLTPRRE